MVTHCSAVELSKLDEAANKLRESEGNKPELVGPLRLGVRRIPQILRNGNR